MRRIDLKGGHWKLWHDVRVRAFASLLIVMAVLYGALGPNQNHPRPRPCVTSSYRMLNVLHPVPWQSPSAQQAAIWKADRDALRKHCPSATVPMAYYSTLVEEWRSAASQRLWTQPVPFVLLFIGILLSVGPPFSGEAMEAFTLTFSLPWSRQRWLLSKAALSLGLICALLVLICLVNVLADQFPYLREVSPPRTGALPHGPSLIEISRALIAGCVGVALGTWMSVITRNALAATLGAGIIAYALVGIDLGALFPNALFNHVTILNLDSTTSVFVALVIVCGTWLLSSIRLRNTDF